jgi:hypothetical protein
MQNFIKCLNENQGAVMAFLTLVYVATTIAIAFINKGNLKLLADLEKQRVRPYVVFSLFIIYGESRTVATSIKNFGLTAAKNVEIKVEPKLTLVGIDNCLDDAISSTVIKILPPNTEIVNHLGNSVDFRAKYDDSLFKGKVKYFDNSGNEYNEDFEINLLDLIRVKTSTITQTFAIEDMFSMLNKKPENGG